MLDLRPVGYVIGLLVMVLGATMFAPMLLDFFDGNAHWPTFAITGLLSCLTGGFLALACANGTGQGLTIQQTFLLTTSVWLALPIFGALPFWLGATEARFVDAFFEAMSGLTTTGSTVFRGLEELPRGLLLWRGLLQWFGGIGIIVVAMVFLPMLKVGGMQIFRTESFDTFGKILPRAAEIAKSISTIYLSLTLLCALAYAIGGLTPFDAIVHAMTTIATGGFANSDRSFSEMGPMVEYVAVVFMLAAALPFVRYVQLLSGTAKPLIADSQVRLFFLLVALVVLSLTGWQMLFSVSDLEQSFRKGLFNGVSILTGTGYASADYGMWGSFPVAMFFLIGLVGGCAGSTSCSIKVFRFQLLFASIRAQVQKIYTPNGIFSPRYEGRRVPDDILSSVMAFFMLFMVTLIVLSIFLALTGLDMITAISGAATALANVGPGLGPEIGPSGNFSGLNDSAKWLLIAGMLIGRLELMSVYVLFTYNFWRR